MAVIGGGAQTLADLAVAMGPNNQISPVLEILSQSNPILDDIPWIEGNLLTGMQTTVRTSLPQGTWRLLNSGALISKSTRTVITETCAILQDYSFVDRDLAGIGGNPAAYRESEDRAHVMGLGQQMAQTLFYGNTAPTPAQFLGIAPRYNSLGLTGSAGVAGGNVISMNGTGTTNASIYLIGWSPDTVHGIYPKGSQAGLQVTDVTTLAPISDGAGGLYRAYQTEFQWKAGLAVRDWRFVVRIANIDVTQLTANAATGANLINAMIRALALVAGLPNSQNVRWAFYTPRAVASFFDLQAVSKANSYFVIGDGPAGRMPFTQLRGVPIKPMDKLLTTEAAVTAAT